MNQLFDSHIVELLGPRELIFKSQALDLSKLDSHSVAAKTLYSAISPGTELAAWRGDPPLRPGPVYPRLVGYCNVAEVIMVGANVQTLKAGDRILTTQSHRSAFICEQNAVIGRVPDALGSIEATTTYLFHLGYNALLKGDFRPGHAVAVLGLGTLGMGSVQLAQALGGQVFALSNHTDSLHRAQSMGARGSWRKDTPHLARLLAELTGGSGIDLVINTSNSWEDWWLALSLPRKEGVISVLGFPGRGQPPPSFNPLDLRYFYDNQLRLVAAGFSSNVTVAPHEIRFTITRNCAYLMELLVSERLKARALVGGTKPAYQISSCYEALCANRSTGLTCCARLDPKMSETKLKAGLIGCGRIGAFTRPELRDSLPAGWLPLSHAEAIRAIPGYELAALCDVDAQLLDKAVAAHEVAHAFGDYREMVRIVQPDVISIATRTAGRCDVIEYVARHGVRGVHVEKPISTNIGDCRRALTALRLNKTQITYGALRRFMDVYREARAMVKAGEIGELIQIEAQMGRTLLLWNYPHSVDLLLFFAGTAQVEYVWANCAIQEGAVQSADLVDDDPLVEHAVIRFANGVTG